MRFQAACNLFKRQDKITKRKCKKNNILKPLCKIYLEYSNTFENPDCFFYQLQILLKFEKSGFFSIPTMTGKGEKTRELQNRSRRMNHFDFKNKINIDV